MSKPKYADGTTACVGDVVELAEPNDVFIVEAEVIKLDEKHGRVELKWLKEFVRPNPIWIHASRCELVRGAA